MVGRERGRGTPGTRCCSSAAREAGAGRGRRARRGTGRRGTGVRGRRGCGSQRKSGGGCAGAQCRRAELRLKREAG